MRLWAPEMEGVMDRAGLRGKVQTVVGTIDPAKLGRTLMHEHLLCDLRTPEARKINEPDEDITLKNVWGINYGRKANRSQMVLNLKDVAIAEMEAMRDLGGNSVVELTCGGIRPDPKGLRDISLGTGVNIVMGCGYYVEEYQDPANRERTPDDFAREMIAQVMEGAWGTDVRAGVIGEIGTQNPWTELEKRVMRGAVMAQLETGAALNIHPGRREDLPLEIATTIEDWGAELSRTVISHIDRTIFDLDGLLRLAETGVVLEFDMFGVENTYYPLKESVDMPNDGMRLRLIRGLLDHGYLDQVVISHDIDCRTRLINFGGHGYGHIFENVVPLMKARNFSDAEIDGILIDNPRRLLTFV
jgi:phosphotriesterase-related protein